jgi:lipoate-protein ligase B
MALRSRWLDRISYAAALALQEEIVARKINDPRADDELLLLEHEPVYTIGRTPDQSSLRSPEALPHPLVQTGRGGQATYHGPGQLVGYPLIDLRHRGQDLHRYLRALEELLIAILHAYGIDGQRREGLTGVWVAQRKIASIGVGVRRWVSMHGFALNVCGDLSPFQQIIPCGIAGVEMSSVEREAGRAISVREIAAEVERVFETEFTHLLPRDSYSMPQPANPLLQESTLPYQLPPFDRISDGDFLPAFEHAMPEALREVEAIANEATEPTFENTIVALERSGRALASVSRVFWNLNTAHTNPALQKIESEIAPRLAAHRDAIALNERLFARIDALYQKRDELSLDAEAAFLLERYYKDFVRAGARLSAEEKPRLKKINGELATLQAQFRQNVLKEMNAATVFVDDVAQLRGMTRSAIEAAAAVAREDGQPGKYGIRVRNTTSQPALKSLEDRALRQHLLEVSMRRNSQAGEWDNREVITRISRLRAERAQLLGYAHHAAYSLEDQTALSAKTVNDFLAKLAPAAVANARRETAELQRLAMNRPTVSRWRLGIGRSTPRSCGRRDTLLTKRS